MILITKARNGEAGEIGDPEWKGENRLKHGQRDAGPIHPKTDHSAKVLK